MTSLKTTVDYPRPVLVHEFDVVLFDDGGDEIPCMVRAIRCDFVAKQFEIDFTSTHDPNATFSALLQGLPAMIVWKTLTESGAVMRATRFTGIELTAMVCDNTYTESGVSILAATFSYLKAEHSLTPKDIAAGEFTVV